MPHIHRRTIILFAAALALAATAVAQESRPQTRFVSIDNIQGFSGFFNVGQGTVRIVSIVSPGAADCEARLHGISEMLAGVPSKRVRVYVVFTPRVEGDDQRTALIRCAELNDRRVACFWDPNGAVAAALGPVLDSAAGATPCLVFDTDAVLRDPPDAPLAWMAAGADGKHAFDADALQAVVTERLAAFEKRENQPAAEGQTQ